MFDKVYVIHLPDAERYASITAELKKIGVEDAEFVHAEPPRGRYPNMRRNPAVEMGCNLSHFKAIVKAAISGARRPLFLEDDVCIQNDAISRLKAAESVLRPSWDILYLGGHPRGKIKAKINDNLVKIGLFSFAESYILNGASIPSFIDYWFDRIGRPNAMIDFILGEWAADNEGFAVYPALTAQKQFKSKISNKVDHKENLILKGWTNCWPGS